MYFSNNEFSCTETVDPPNDIVVIVTFLMAMLLIIALIIFVVMKTRRRRSYSPNAECSESEPSEDEVALQQIKDIPADA